MAGSRKVAVLSWVSCLPVLLVLAGGPAGAHTPHDAVSSIALSPSFETDGVLFCNLAFGSFSLLKSTDGGDVWRPSQDGVPAFVSVAALSPDYPADGIAFLGTDRDGAGELYKSLDGGATWESSGAGLSGARILSIALSPAYPADRTLFAGTKDDGVYRSTDGGATWVSTKPPGALFTVSSIALSPAYPADRTLFAGTEKGIWKSTDGGDSWFNPVVSGFKEFWARSVALSPLFPQDGTVFAGVWGNGVYRSTDGGVTWEKKSAGITDLYITSVALSPSYGADGIVLAATQTAGIFRSVNGGESWTLANEGLDKQTIQTDTHYFSLVFSPAFSRDDTVFLASFEGVHKSVDGGKTWRHMNLFNQNMMRGVAVSPGYASDKTVFAAAYGGGVYRSRDGGGTWTAVDTGLTWMYPGAIAVSPDFTHDSTLFAGVYSDVMKSTSGGDGWFALGAAPSEWFYCRTMAVSPAFATDRVLFAGSVSQGPYAIYKSSDGGATFVPLDSPFKSPRRLAISSQFYTDHTIFAATERGIFRSKNGGALWKAMGYQGISFLSVALSPAFGTDGEVLVGSEEFGVYKSEDFGDTWNPCNDGIPNPMVIEDVAFSPAYQSDRTVFAATKSRGFYVSTDGGGHWQCLGLDGVYIHRIALSPGFPGDGTIFLGTWDGVHRTTDGGATWEQVLDIRRYDDQDEFMTYTGDWTRYKDEFTTGAGLAFSSDPGAEASLAFNGTSITWIGAKVHFGGIADVYVDGQLAGQVSCYSPQTQYREVLFTKTDLGPGHHTIRIAVTGVGDVHSLGQAVFIDAFQSDL